MSSRRLTDSDKQDIVELYRQPGHTTLTLAEHYGVSNTTISRILKTSLSSEEYESLIQQKRTARFSSGATVQGNLLETEPVVEAAESKAVELESVELEPFVELQPSLSEPESIPEPEPIYEPEPVPEPEPKKVTAPVLRRSSGVSQKSSSVGEEVELGDLLSTDAVTEPEKPAPSVKKIIGANLTLQHSVVAQDDEEDDDDDDDLDSALSGEFDDDDEDGDDAPVLPSIQLNATDFIQVLPIAEAAIPRTCYLVVDRSAELVARPLQEFAELGQIPSEEIQERTLPVFDNHRVARRFSNIRTQRVIKVPDSRVLQKAANHLQAKGITRLLIDGQVYAL